MDRKQFFKEFICRTVDVIEKSKVGKALNVVPESSTIKERPPGAQLSDEKFLSRCTGCDACMAACPVHAIMIEDLERRDPLLYPKDNPCIQCPGTPCISACPTGALNRQFGIYRRKVQD